MEKEKREPRVRQQVRLPSERRPDLTSRARRLLRPEALTRAGVRSLRRQAARTRQRQRSGLVTAKHQHARKNNVEMKLSSRLLIVFREMCC